MSKPPTLASAMTPFPYSMDVAEPVAKAQELMALHRVRHLPVTHNGQTVGVVADQDILLLKRIRAANDTLAAVSNLAAEPAMRIGAIASQQVYVVDIHTPLADVALELANRRISVAVVERKGKLAGILTMTDVARTLSAVLRGDGPPPVHSA